MKGQGNKDTKATRWIDVGAYGQSTLGHKCTRIDVCFVACIM
jgi:hypothetical protein